MASTPTDMSAMISRYLAGLLPEEEAEAFERAISEQPELRNETERFLRIKEGFARLERRGQLAPLMRQATLRRWLPGAAAAAVLLVALGSLYLLQIAHRPSALLAMSPQTLEAGDHSASILASYMLARTRGEAPGVDLDSARSAGILEFRILPSTLTAGTHYAVQVVRSDASAGRTTLGAIDAVPIAPDGYVSVYLDARQLPPGQYSLVLTPSSAGREGAEVDRFDIHLH